MADDLASFIESQKRKLEKERAEILQGQKGEVNFSRLKSLTRLLDCMPLYIIKVNINFWRIRHANAKLNDVFEEQPDMLHKQTSSWHEHSNRMLKIKLLK